MTKIYKYKLEIKDTQNLHLPHDFKILSLQMQDGVPCIWCEVNPELPLKEVTLYCLGTGREVDFIGKHIGTVLDEPFVWHFYIL